MRGSMEAGEACHDVQVLVLNPGSRDEAVCNSEAARNLACCFRHPAAALYDHVEAHSITSIASTYACERCGSEHNMICTLISVACHFGV